MVSVDDNIVQAADLEVLNAVIADMTELRTKVIAILAKLDDDTGVADTNYEATLTPAALTTTT